MPMQTNTNVNMAHKNVCTPCLVISHKNTGNHGFCRSQFVVNAGSNHRHTVDDSLKSNGFSYSINVTVVCPLCRVFVSLYIFIDFLMRMHKNSHASLQKPTTYFDLKCARTYMKRKIASI